MLKRHDGFSVRSFFEFKITRNKFGSWICNAYQVVTLYRTCTRVTLKLLTPPWRFGHWANTKNSSHSKVKREDWTGRKREKLCQLGPSTETGTVQGWAMDDSWCNCAHSIKQSMTASSDKAIVLPKNLTELDPTTSRHPSWNYPRSRIESASILTIITQFWRIHCTVEPLISSSSRDPVFIHLRDTAKWTCVFVRFFTAGVCIFASSRFLSSASWRIQRCLGYLPGEKIVSRWARSEKFAFYSVFGAAQRGSNQVVHLAMLRKLIEMGSRDDEFMRGSTV